MSRLVRAAVLLVLSTASPALAAPAAPPLAAAAVPRPGPEGESVGLYPLQLPQGQEALQDRLLGQLHDGAAALPRLRAFDLLPRGACLPDEGGCLAAAARSAQLTEMVSGQVEATAKGYRFHLRLFSAKDGALLEQHRAAVEGGPLDLAGGLEHGVCALLGAAPCAGTLVVRADGDVAGARLSVDGRDEGALPLAKPLSIPIGRHVVKVGADERRVRVSYQRETRLLCAQRAGAPALLDDLADTAALPAPPLALAAPPPKAEATDVRSRTGRWLVAGGAALVATAAGLEWLSRSQASALDDRYARGALTDADKPRYGQVQAAGTAALIAGATGLAAMAAGGAVLLFFTSTPSGAAPGAGVQGRF